MDEYGLSYRAIVRDFEEKFNSLSHSLIQYNRIRDDQQISDEEKQILRGRCELAIHQLRIDAKTIHSSVDIQIKGSQQLHTMFIQSDTFIESLQSSTDDARATLELERNKKAQRGYLVYLSRLVQATQRSTETKDKMNESYDDIRTLLLKEHATKELISSLFTEYNKLVHDSDKMVQSIHNTRAEIDQRLSSHQLHRSQSIPDSIDSLPSISQHDPNFSSQLTDHGIAHLVSQYTSSLLGSTQDIDDGDHYSSDSDEDHGEDHDHNDHDGDDDDDGDGDGEEHDDADVDIDEADDTSTTPSGTANDKTDNMDDDQ